MMVNVAQWLFSFICLCAAFLLFFFCQFSYPFQFFRKLCVYFPFILWLNCLEKRKKETSLNIHMKPLITLFLSPKNNKKMPIIRTIPMQTHILHPKSNKWSTIDIITKMHASQNEKSISFSFCLSLFFSHFSFGFYFILIATNSKHKNNTLISPLAPSFWLLWYFIFLSLICISLCDAV